MDEPKYSTLLEAVAAVPDPRKARGKRHPWPLLLAIICSALASQQQSGLAIAEWVRLHAHELRVRLQPPNGRLPSEATLRRCLRLLDVAALEQQLARFQPVCELPSAPPVVSPQGEILQGQALDGKTIRGATAHGCATHLLSLVQHDTGATSIQAAVSVKKNEISAAPALLRGHTGPGTVTTMDALHTQRKLAQQIHTDKGWYMMIAKRNQRCLYDDLELFFRIPAIVADCELWDRVTTVSKGHGRLETRTLECSTGLCEYLDWPGVAQVVRRTCTRVVLKTGKQTQEVSYGITNLTPLDARAPQLEALWRGHWTIENRKHYVRDVTMGEDAGQAYCGSTPQALAALRNGLIDLMRAEGWTNIADALRYYAASVPRALNLVGAFSFRL